MGSKSRLLDGELGVTILEIAREGERFVDLFAGSGSVSHFVAEELPIPVLSVDLQNFSRPLALSVTGRTSPLQTAALVSTWIDTAKRALKNDPKYEEALSVSDAKTRKGVLGARALCARPGKRNSPVWKHYGGHYYSPVQALAMDHLLRRLPDESSSSLTAQAALLRTASICAAAPGHTAQPFQPTPSLIPFIANAWSHDVFEECEREIHSLGERYARRKGKAILGDAVALAGGFNEGDTVFCDPPYSNAQYSRFYHVLEGISIGGWPSVSGAGRAPERVQRATSDFSTLSSSFAAFERLFKSLADCKATAIFTFPAGEASNGLSGTILLALAEERFHVLSFHVPHVHSTLGGPSKSQGLRGSRRSLNEIVMVLRPKRS